MREEDEDHKFCVYDTVTGNLVLCGDELDKVKSRIESWYMDLTGLVIFDETAEERVFEYHGPMVAP